MAAAADELPVTGADERIQPVGSDDPHWVDAHTFFAWEPRDGVFLLARLAVLPNVPATTAGVLGWAAAQPAYSYGYALDEAPLGDWDDLTIAGVQVEELEPLSVWELHLDDGDNGLSLRWEAWGGAVRHPSTGKPGTGHYEQSCRVRGSVSFGGRTTEVDGVGQRRHTWGFGDRGGHAITAWLGAGGRLDERAFHVLDPGPPCAPSGSVRGRAEDVRVVDLIRTTTEGSGGVPETVELVATLEGGSTSAARGAAHGAAITVAASPSGGLTHLQPMRFISGDGLEGYGLYERTEVAGGSPASTLP